VGVEEDSVGVVVELGRDVLHEELDLVDGVGVALLSLEAGGLLGLLVITGNVGRWFILALCAVILYVFASKGSKVGNTTWKYYNRIVISYSAIALLQLIPSKSISDNKELNDLISETARRSAGAILIADALIAFNVRDIFNKLSD
jgi:hypothetical protein